MITERFPPWRLTQTLMLFGLIASIAARAEPPEPPVAAQAAQQVVYPDSLRARLLRDEASPVRGLDEAIFTGLSPVSASDPAVRLPEDQRLEEPAKPAAP